jgi:hypothetical protein
MHWHAWVSRPDFLQWVDFPASNISAEQSKNAQDHEIIRVKFHYKDRIYTVIFTDEGYDSNITDSDQYDGKAEFFAGDELVLGLDIYKKMWPDYERWRWLNVFAFVPGEWMKDLIEISTIIEKWNEKSMAQFGENDALARAKNIRL